MSHNNYKTDIKLCIILQLHTICGRSCYGVSKGRYVIAGKGISTRKYQNRSEHSLRR